MKTTGTCDKCGKNGQVTVEEFVCLSEHDNIPANKKEKYSTTFRFLASVTSRLCDECAGKRKKNFLLAALLFFVSSLPFLIWWIYLELGFVLLIISVTVLFLSSSGHEMEYIAKVHYRKLVEGKEDAILNPKIIKKARWEEIKKDPAKFSSAIVDGEEIS